MIDVEIAAIAINRSIGANDERLRIARLIRALPLAACFCGEWTLLLPKPWHSDTCEREAEAEYRNKLIAAVFGSPVDAGARALTGGTSAGEPTTAADLPGGSNGG